VLPRVAVLGTVRRVARRLLRSIGAGPGLEIRKPLVVRLPHEAVARLDDEGTACRLYAGILEELAERYTGRDATVRHSACMAEGAAVCEWVLAESGEDSRVRSKGR
jgi:predicted hydrocarbon binding protein